METTIWGLGFKDSIWGFWGSYYNLPEAIFYLLKGNYMFVAMTLESALLKAPGNL